MNLDNYYYYFQNAIPERICNEIIAWGNYQREELAVTGGFEKNNLSKEQKKKLKKIRNSNVAWLNDPWIYNEIIPYIKEANIKAGWNFQWDNSETCQFTKYKLNQYYHWHCDSYQFPFNTPNDPIKHGKIRKLSVTVSLSNPEEYKGGELQFDCLNKHRKSNIITCKEILPKGSLVVFPSFVWHQVKPVTKGTRYSLVIWNLGDPFK
jgi:PKHD-type hydroxylase